MVQVPRSPLRTVKTQTPSSVSGNAYQSPSSPNIPKGAFGDGGAAALAMSKNLGMAADDIGKIVLQMQQEDNETKAKEADARIADGIRTIMLGDPNDQEAAPGYLMTRGSTSVEALGASEERIRALVAKETESAGRNRQLGMLISDAAHRRVNTALDRMVGHANEQRLVHQEETSLAREAQALADAAADWQDPKAIDNSLGIVAAEVADRAEAQGMSPEATQAMLKQRQSVIVKGAFDAALISQDVVRAQSIFSTNADKLDGPTRNTMAQALAADVMAVQSQKLASEAWSKFKGDPVAARAYIREAVDGKQESEAIKELNTLLGEREGDIRLALALESAARAREADRAPAVAQRVVEETIEAVGADASPAALRRYIRENYSGKEERAAMEELDHRLNQDSTEQSRAREDERYKRALEQQAIQDADYEYQMRVRERREAQRGARQSGYAAIDQGMSVSEWRAANPALYDTLAAEDDIRGLVETQRAVQTGKLYATASDGETLAKLTGLPHSELAQVNPVEVRLSLTESEYSRLITAVASAKGRQAADETQRQVYNVGEDALRNSAPETLLKSTGGKKIFNDANNALGEWIGARMKAGKEPTTQEIRTEATRLMLRVQSDRAWYINDFEGLAAQVGDMTPAERSTAMVEIDQIPDAIKRSIADDVRAFDPGFDPRLIPDEIMEQIAGALAVGDQARHERLIKQVLKDHGRL